MKKLCIALLALMLLFTAALGEEEIAPFELGSPAGTEWEWGEDYVTCVSGTARVVVQVLTVEVEEDMSAALPRLMETFSPGATAQEEKTLQQGVHLLTAITADAPAEGLTQVTTMVLTDAGDLLILAGYDLNGDFAAAEALVQLLLEELTITVLPAP